MLCMKVEELLSLLLRLKHLLLHQKHFLSALACWGNLLWELGVFFERLTLHCLWAGRSLNLDVLKLFEVGRCDVESSFRARFGKLLCHVLWLCLWVGFKVLLSEWLSIRKELCEDFWWFESLSRPLRVVIYLGIRRSDDSLCSVLRLLRCVRQDDLMVVDLILLCLVQWPNESELLVQFSVLWDWPRDRGMVLLVALDHMPDKRALSWKESACRLNCLGLPLFTLIFWEDLWILVLGSW